MQKWLLCCLVALSLCGFVACEKAVPPQKVGVSMSAGGAARWAIEMAIMEERAKELGLAFEGRLTPPNAAKTQIEDCRELIDSGIHVLILTPRNLNKAGEILEYAKARNVKVISYARAVMGEGVDLFVGFDSYNIGLSMGQYLADRVPQGDIILLKGDEQDFNTPLLFHGAMKVLKPLIDRGDLRVILEDYVERWLPEKAKEMVTKAVQANGNRVQAILAPNDRLAGGSREALQALGVTEPVIITGMDAELVAVKRLVAGTQDFTVFMDLRNLARTAMDEAHSLVTQKKNSTNTVSDTQNLSKVDAYLINGRPVTRENLDAVLIETGVYTLEQVYGKP